MKNKKEWEIYYEKRSLLRTFLQVNNEITQLEFNQFKEDNSILNSDIEQYKDELSSFAADNPSFVSTGGFWLNDMRIMSNILI